MFISLTRYTQNILYYTLPIAFWLLAGVGSIVGYFLLFSPSRAGSVWWEEAIAFFLPPVLVLISIILISSIQPHTRSTEECFWMGMLLGIASVWMPSVVFLALPAWSYLFYRLLLTRRSLLATAIGWAVVAVWLEAFYYAGILKTPLCAEGFWCGWRAWIPTGAVVAAYAASTIARKNLRVR